MHHFLFTSVPSMMLISVKYSGGEDLAKKLQKQGKKGFGGALCKEVL